MREHRHIRFVALNPSIHNMVEAAQQESNALCTNLILVCCHATYTGEADRISTSHLDENAWILKPYQRSNAATGKQSEHHTFLLHILAGLQECKQDPNALLIFSGGRTTSSDRTEAQSYRILSRKLQSETTVLDRVFTEDLASDTYQNLLFSILRFHDVTGRYPADITVITHAFKERRILEQHAVAIRWPAEKIRVQGINPPFSLIELEQVQRGEYENAAKLYAEFPYGTHSETAAKWGDRNWSPGMDRKQSVDADVEALLRWRGGECGKEIFAGKLPW